MQYFYFFILHDKKSPSLITAFVLQTILIIVLKQWEMYNFQKVYAYMKPCVQREN